MKKLLLLSIVNVSCFMIAMKPEFARSQKPKPYKLTIVRYDDYEERQLNTGKKIDNLVIENKEIYGTIEKNSIISVKSFPFPNKKEQYAEYRLTVITDKQKSQYKSANGKVIFSLDYNEKAKENDTYEAPLFDKLIKDIASFKENNLKRVESFFYEKKSKKGIRDQVLNTIFTKTLDESPEIVFPKAYQQKKIYDSSIAPLYQVTVRDKFYKIKNF